MQEIALILAGINCFQQLESLPRLLILHRAHARIVAGGDQVGAQLHGVVEKGLEFDFGIAQHVGIWCVFGLVFLLVFGVFVVFVFGGVVVGFVFFFVFVGVVGCVVF